MSKYAIQAEGLGKVYIIGGVEQRHDSFREMLTGALTAPLRRLRKLGGAASEEEQFWALQDISFNVAQGEVLGVIGRNGAGKSTLLKVLSRITAPTTGHVAVRGRLASLLEVGTGFHPELTGRENIFLNGAILGMTRRDIARKFDEIVAFAEVGKFIYTPVKRYSSGMYVRLAFSVAAHLDADVLLVDEVLAVGDSAFQRKSLGMMENVASCGRSVLFVSHNLDAVRKLCGRALVLENGQLAFQGGVEDALTFYENKYAQDSEQIKTGLRGELAKHLQLNRLSVKQFGDETRTLDPRQPFVVDVEATALRSFMKLEIDLGIFRDGIRIANCYDTDTATAADAGHFVSVFEFPGNVFQPGRYTLGLGAVAAMGEWAWGSDLAILDFTANPAAGHEERTLGAIAIPYQGRRVHVSSSVSAIC